MAPLVINVSGTSSISRRAERAVVSISVSSNGPDQQKTTSEVTETAKQLQSDLRTLAPKADPTVLLPESPITHWSMSTLSTGSYFIWLDAKDEDGQLKKTREYNASTSFEIKFADFAKLGAVCTDLANMPFVSIRNISWRLTEKTKASLWGQSRSMAVEDAVTKAKDFAAAVGKTKVRAVEINSDTDGLFGRTASAFGGAQIMRSRGIVGQNHSEEEELSFEPEEVEMNCTVKVKFEAE